MVVGDGDGSDSSPTLNVGRKLKVSEYLTFARKLYTIYKLREKSNRMTTLCMYKCVKSQFVAKV